MSRGISPIEFVRQVYYAQEKVYLDFVPTDDKYKEVLLEANFVLQELQKEEDWLWLRSQEILAAPDNEAGLTSANTRWLPVPDNFYKVSTLFNDALRLYAHKPKCTDANCLNYGHKPGETWDEEVNGVTVEKSFDWSVCRCKCFDRAPYILIPFVSMGWQNDHAQRQMSYITRPNVADITLGVTTVNDGESEKIVFDRPLYWPEINRVPVLQYQRLLEPFHICNDDCVGVDPSKDISYDPTKDDNGNRLYWNPCNQIYIDADTPKLMLTEIPDPFYVIIRTAQYHAEGSPPAQGRIAGLQDQAQKMLSSMRENNAAATQVDFIPSWNPGFWMVT